MIQFLVKNVLIPFQDFIYPPVCLACDRMRRDRKSKICADCWNALVPLTGSHPVVHEIKRKLSGGRLVEDVLSCFLFEKVGKLQDITYLLKYRGIKSLGVELGRIIGRSMILDSRFTGADHLVPVPLHRIKQRERGYNQSEYLCKGISDVTHIPVHTSLLVRIKYTESQTRLTLDEREQNVGEAFMVNEKFRPHVDGKTFILVDDVITTGSTVLACARQLRSCGAKNVLAVSAALAQ